MAIKIYADAGSNLFKGIIEKRNAEIKIVNMSLTIDERIYNCYEDEYRPGQRDTAGTQRPAFLV